MNAIDKTLSLFCEVSSFTRIEDIMKYSPLVSITVSLSIVYLMAFLCPVAESYCLELACSADSSCRIQEKVIYHQTMTPSWLVAHASYIDSSHSHTTEQLTFNAGSTTNAALLKIPMIPAGLVQDSTPLTVDIIVAPDVSIGQSEDSDIRYGLSDGTKFIGFETNDAGNYGTHSPCYGLTGVPGPTFTSAQQIAPLPKPSDSFYPGQYVMTLKLDEGWGSCYTAHDGGFVKTAVYGNNGVMPSQGLALEVYKRHSRERVGIKYIKVAITQDA